MRALVFTTWFLTAYLNTAGPTANDEAPGAVITDAGSCDYWAYRRSTCT